MKRINLKDLKLALDKIPIGELEGCYITHPYASETPDDDELKLIKYGDNWGKFFEKYDTAIIQAFAKSVFEDSKKVMEVIKNLDKAEDYADDYPEEVN